MLSPGMRCIVRYLTSCESFAPSRHRHVPLGSFLLDLVLGGRACAAALFVTPERPLFAAP